VQYIASTDPTLCGSMLKHEGRRQTDRRSADAGSRLKLIDASGRSRLIRQPFSRNGENSPYGMLGGIEERSSRQGRSLAGCKSPYRQLPVFGRLAYPERAEVTKHDVPGRRSPGCPAAVFAAVGTIWGASKLGGRNITKYLQPRNATPREVVIRGQTREADPTLDMGKADGAVEETGASTRSTAGAWGPASKKRFSD